MIRLNFSRPKNAAKAKSIWHKLIPGAAISLQLLLDSFLGSIFDSTRCNENGNTEGIIRTMAFLVSWGVGLKCMKWTAFASDDGNMTVQQSKLKKISRHWKHAFVNVGLVTSWLFAVSDFPLKCWLDGDGGDTHNKAISATRGVLLIIIQALAALEVFDVDLSDADGCEHHEPESFPGEEATNETSGLL